MAFTLHAACLCSTGRIRSNNEDNFFFHKYSLRQENSGLQSPLVYDCTTEKPQMFAVFDGMGGEAHGEAAAFAAAKAAYGIHRREAQVTREFLEQTARKLNAAVFQAAQALFANRMGATLAMLCFQEDTAWVCNLGDSRIFLLRQGSLTQISMDHTDEKELRLRGLNRKPHLTQHLGIDPEEMLVEPHIQPIPMAAGDRFLICSDGLTDMLSVEEITQVLSAISEPKACAETLVARALENGGRDNVTVILCDAE